MMERKTCLSLTIALIVCIAGSRAHELTIESLAEIVLKLEQQGLMQAELIQKQNTEISNLHKVVDEYKIRLQQQETINEDYARRLKKLEKALHVPVTDEAESKKDEDSGDELNIKEQATPERETLIRNARSSFESPDKIRPWRSLDEGVAFHAVFRTADPTPTIYTNRTIVYPDVITNIGNGYSNGIFVAPADGIYLFSVSVACHHHTGANVYIMKNGAILAGAFGDAYGNFEQGSVTVTTRLAKNDSVWTKLTTYPNNAVYGLSYTSFTGCLVLVL